jgi:4-diphosphocytidyl-2-C-methyl-D-erythritol kinase
MRVDQAVRVRAPAKVNLTLRVLGVRADGYHELRTTFQSIARYDTLTFVPERGPFRIDCDEASCPGDRTNLVWQAAERLWRAMGRRGAPRDVRVRLQKTIPLQAGLGGGSSDAAATLRALSVLWRSRLRDADLHVIGTALGADVPYFLEGGTVLGVGRGDRLFLLAEPPAAWVAVVVPGFGVSTRSAYAWWDAAAGASLGPAQPGGTEGWPIPAADRGNDLQAPVASRHPEIRRLLRELGRHGASYAAMSGSGSAVFGVFDSRAGAAGAAEALARGRRRTFVARTLNRREYARQAKPHPLPVRSRSV